MDNYAIDIQGLNKTYAGSNFQALQDINLQIPKNSIYGLLGPNGAGKSTLINILAGLVVKSSGKIKILGNDFDADPVKIKYLLGVVPQEIALDHFFDVEGAVNLHSGYFGIVPENRKTVEILSAIGLLDKRHSIPRMLSGGMKRRLMIAKAMVHSPPILILDEPTAGVDVELREQLWDYVRELRNNGATIILTTHYLAEAEELCDEISFINKGQIIKSDKTENLLNDLDSKKLIIECDAPIPESIIFPDIELDGNRIIANLSHDESMNHILQSVLALGIQIKNIYVETLDLEDIYKKYIPK